MFSPQLPHATCFTPLFRPSKTLQFLAECVPFAAGTIEAAGSFPLHVYQHLHEADLDYSLPPWRYNDIDVFVTAPHVYSEIVESFETALKEHGYHVTHRKIKRYSGRAEMKKLTVFFRRVVSVIFGSLTTRLKGFLLMCLSSTTPR